MKLTISIFALLLSTLFCYSQEESKREVLINDGDTSYYMKRYIMCFLKMGHNRYQSKSKTDKIQEGHLNHIDSLADLGLIVLAGPFADDGYLRGILVFDVDNEEEAKTLEKNDPAVKSGRLEMEFHPWWTAKGSVLK